MYKYAVLFMVLVLFIGCSRKTATQLLDKAEGAHKAKLYDEALLTYKELVETYPDSIQSANASYALGYIYQNIKNDYRTAVEYYKNLVKKFPSHPTAANAAFLIGFLYANELHMYDSARIAYEHFLKNYPQSPYGLIEAAKTELENLGKDPGTVLTEAQTKTEKKK